MILSQDGQYTVGREARWREGIDIILSQMRKASNHEPVRVLDVGCGEGSCFMFLKKRIEEENLPLQNLEYYAIDSNEALTSILKDSGIIFRLGDFTKLNSIYQKNFFDVIVASEVIEHVTETDAFILSLKDILKDSGYIYLTTPNMASWHGRLALMFGFQPLATEVSSIRAEFGKGNILKKYYHGNAIMHVRVFTLRALVDFVTFHKFKIEHIYGGGYRSLDNLVFKRWFVGLSPIIKLVLRKS
jgi:2-polyprenyl-3-methyl-5-hydroxy-6-metoxy-1,4-benzoquinol methylase